MNFLENHPKIDREDPAPLSSLEVVSLTSTLSLADAAVSTAKEESAKASMLAAEARTAAARRPLNTTGPLTCTESATHTNDDRFFGLNHSDDRSYWSNAHEKQLTALKMARNVRRGFRNYETGMRRTWIGRKLSKEPESHDLGRQCAYFAIMGGYTFRPLKKLEGLDNEYTLAPEGLAFLMRENIITPASFTTHRPEVADKGKSDMLAKLLVCIQALWMVVNCISRRLLGCLSRFLNLTW